VAACQAAGHGFEPHFPRSMLSNYTTLLIYILISLGLAILIYGLSFILVKQVEDTEKLSAYECGFNPYNDARKVFDVRFYLIAILFIVFDLETAFIFPWVLTLDCNYSLGYWTMIEFVAELVTGYVYVWGLGALEWH
jgi:NADH-quinone oxidoreductase subunit A